MCQDCGCSLTTDKKVIDVQKRILEKNESEAAHNREKLDKHRILGLNLMSSPGSGKTTLLEKTIEMLNGELRVGVIEGDIETDRDAERIKNKGVPVHQITTGQTCHLDAEMVHRAMHQMPLEELDILFVENVGNLVCPAAYDIGTHKNIVLLSLTEGDDKPAKYPLVFLKSHLMVITKTDLAGLLDFDIDKAIGDARRINPSLEVIRVSAKSGDGMEEWIRFLKTCHQAHTS
ncbi:MAG: hydrogenase accessory protein HypB [Nitrospirae bacterium]|nr:MAG: hydrogenase accessory protein HypB [Nitrospirota bacterium]